MKVSDVDSVELDDKGAIKGADKLTESIKSEWADFITTTETRGAQTSNPPANNNSGAMTKADIYKRMTMDGMFCPPQSVKRRSWKIKLLERTELNGNYQC